MRALSSTTSSINKITQAHQLRDHNTHKAQKMIQIAFCASVRTQCVRSCRALRCFNPQMILMLCTPKNNFEPQVDSQDRLCDAHLQRVESVSKMCSSAEAWAMSDSKSTVVKNKTTRMAQKKAVLPTNIVRAVAAFWPRNSIFHFWSPFHHETLFWGEIFYFGNKFIIKIHHKFILIFIFEN